MHALTPDNHSYKIVKLTIGCISSAFHKLKIIARK
jgi:hypothetical protein